MGWILAGAAIVALGVLAAAELLEDKEYHNTELRDLDNGEDTES